MATTQQPVVPQTPTDWQALSARAYELQARDRAAADAAAAERMRAAAIEAERTRTRSLGEHAQDATVALIGQGVTGLAQAGYGLLNMSTGGFLDRGTKALGLSGTQFFQDASQYMQTLKSTPMQLRAAHAQDTFKNEGVGAGLGEMLANPTLIADLGLANAAQLIPAVAAAKRVSMVAKAAEAMPAAARASTIAAERAATVAKATTTAEKKALDVLAAKQAQTAIVKGAQSDEARKLATEVAMRRAMYGVTATQTAGSVNVDAINAAEKAGATPGEAQLLGLGAGVAAGATSTLISKLTGAAELEASAARSFFAGQTAGLGMTKDAAISAAKQVVHGGAREGVEEYGQSYGEQGFTNLAGAKPFTEGANQAGVMGALVGTPLGAGLGAFNARSTFRAGEPGSIFDEVAEALVDKGVLDTAKAKLDQHQADLDARPPVGESGQTELPMFGAPSAAGPAAPGAAINPVTGQAEVSPNQLPLGMDLPPEQGNLLGNPTTNEYAPETPAATQQTGVSPAQLPLLPPTDLFGDPVQQRADAAPEAQAQALGTADGRQNDLFNPTLPQITGRSSAVAQAPTPRPAVTAPVGSVARARQVVAQNQYDAAQGVDQAARSAALDAVDTRPLNAPGKSKAPGVSKSELEDAIRQLDVSHPITWVESAGEAASAQVRAGKHWKNFLAQNAGVDPRSDQGFAAANAFLAQNPKTPISARNAIRAAAGMELELTPQQVKAAAKAEAERVATEKAAAAQAKKDAANAARRERAAAKRDAVAFAETARHAQEAADLEARNVAAENAAKAAAPKAKRGKKAEAPVVTPAEAPVVAPAEAPVVAPVSKQAAAKAKAAAKKAAPVAPTTQVKVTTKQMLMLKETADIVAQETGEEVDPAVIATALQRDGADLSKLSALTAAKRYLSASKKATADLEAAFAGNRVADAPAPAVEEDNNLFAAEDFLDPTAMRAIIDETVDAGDAATTIESVTGIAIDEALARGDMDGVRTVYRAIGELADAKKAFASRRAAIEKAVEKDAVVGIGTADTTDGRPRMVALMDSSKQFSRDSTMFGLPGQSAKVRNAVAKRAVTLAIADVNDAGRVAAGAARQGVDIRSPQQTAADWAEHPLLALNDADKAAIYGAVGNAEFDAAVTANPDIRLNRLSDDGFNNPMGTVIRPEVWQRMAGNADAVAAARGDKLVHVADPAALAAMIGPVPSDTKGAYLNGTIYMVQSNITGASDYAMVFAHESAHHGLRSMLGGRTAVVVSRVMANQAMRKLVSARMKQDPTLSRAAAAEEVIVDMHVNGERLPSGIMAKLRAGVMAYFDAILGVRQMVLTDADINALLDGIARYQNGDKSATLGHIASMDRFAVLDATLGDSGFMPNTPMFSRDLQSLEAAIAAANGTARANGMAEYVRGAGEAVKNSFAKQLDSARAGGIRGFLMDFMPLDQIRNHYSRHFGGDNGPLNALLRRIRAREALTNSTIVTDATATYEGKSYTSNPKALADKWGKFNRDGATAHKARAMNELLQVSTLYKVFPNRTGGLENQSGVDYKAAGFTEAQRAEALVTAQKAWAAIGTEGQAIFNESQAMYHHLWQTRYEAIARDIVRVRSGSEAPNGTPLFQRYEVDKAGNVLVGTNGKPVQTKEFRKAIGDAIDTQLAMVASGPYSPLSRYGDFVLIVRDAENKVVWQSGHDSSADRANMEADLFRTGGSFDASGHKVTHTVMKEAANWGVDGIDHGVIEKLALTVDATISKKDHPALHAEMTAALTETYMKSLPQSSFMQHANKRKNIAGATTDAFRAFNEYTLSAARNIAGATHASAISEHAAQMQLHIDAQTKVGGGEAGYDKATLDTQQAVMNSVRRHMEAAANTKRSALVDKTLQAGFMSYMVSPSQMFINAMQTAMVAFPRLAGVYGARKTGPAMAAAVKVFSKSRGDMMGKNSALDMATVEGQVMGQLFRDGVFDFTRTNDMAATARGAHHVAEYGTTQGAGTRGWNAMVEAGAGFITASERFNRQVTALAAVQLEQAANPQTSNETIEQFVQRIANVADRAVYDSHYDYSQSNKPTHMQSPLGSLATQFLQYQYNTLSMMAKDVIDAVGAGDPLKKASARQTLAWMLGMQMTFAGAAGTVLAPLVFAVMDAGRDDDELVDARTDFMRHTNKLLSSGILAGFIDTQRIGADSLIPYFGSKKYAPHDADAKDTMLFHLSQIVGPWFGMVTGTATGLEKVSSGDLAGAFGTTGFLGTPKMLVDFTKASDQAARGIRDSRGIVYGEPNIWDTSLGVLGLRSGERRSLEEKRGAVYSASMHGTARKKEIVDALAKARGEGDNTAKADATAELKAWNAAHPDMAIKGQDVARAVKGLVTSQRNADAFGVPVFKRPTKSVTEAAGL